MEFDTYRNKEDIFRVALSFYYNPSIPSRVFDEMSVSLLNNLVNHNTATVMERAVIAVLTYFTDKGLRVVCDVGELNADEIPKGIPAAWRNAINVIGNGDWQFAKYFLKINTIEYSVFFTYNKGVAVTVVVYYADKQSGYELTVSEQRLNGLCENDRNYKTLFANNIIENLDEKYKSIVKCALLDKPPSLTMTPVL